MVTESSELSQFLLYTNFMLIATSLEDVKIEIAPIIYLNIFEISFCLFFGFFEISFLTEKYVI